MNSVLTRHFNFNRNLLSAIGLWPYQQSKLVQFQVILSLGILMSFIVVQLATFVTAEITFNLIINVLSSVLCFFTLVVNYGWFWSNLQNVKYLLEQLQRICNDLSDKNEIAIIEKYGSNAERLAIRVLLLSMCILFFIITEPFWPRILEIFLSINVSKSHHKMYILAEYFIDQEKYFYLILLHTNIALCIAVVVTSITGPMLVGYLQYACGMFKIASYRMEQAMTIKMLKNINLENNIMICKKITYAVDIHRKAMQFAEFLVSSFEGIFYFFIGITVITISLNLYGVVSFKNDFEEIIQPLLRVLGVFLSVFLVNYVGQEIIDHNNHLFFTVYNVQWYKAPLRIQKLILFLLQRGSRAFNLNLSGLYVSSLDGFATMTTASISYFTVIYSVQQ